MQLASGRNQSIKQTTRPWSLDGKFSALESEVVRSKAISNGSGTSKEGLVASEAPRRPTGATTLNPTIGN